MMQHRHSRSNIPPTPAKWLQRISLYSLNSEVCMDPQQKAALCSVCSGRHCSKDSSNSSFTGNASISTSTARTAMAAPKSVPGWSQTEQEMFICLSHKHHTKHRSPPPSGKRCWVQTAQGPVAAGTGTSSPETALTQAGITSSPKGWDTQANKNVIRNKETSCLVQSQACRPRAGLYPLAPQALLTGCWALLLHQSPSGTQASTQKALQSRPCTRLDGDRLEEAFRISCSVWFTVTSNNFCHTTIKALETTPERKRCSFAS